MVTRVGGDKCPKPGESKIDTTGAGAGCAPGRGGDFVVVGGGWGFWWWRFPLGSVKGGVGVGGGGWGCGQ